MGVDLVLFDGEELVFGDRPRRGEYFLGSKAFAKAYTETSRTAGNKTNYEAGLVLDMVGGRGLQIKREPNSMRLAAKTGSRSVGRRAPGRCDVLSATILVARSLTTTFRSTTSGIPTIDIIDFDYPFWHKADDRPENCSAESLAEVGRVITTWLTVHRRARR